MLLSHRIRINATAAQRDYFARGRFKKKGRCRDSFYVANDQFRTVRGRKRTVRTFAHVFDSSVRLR